MKRDDAIAILKEHETELRQLGVEHLYLFGSTARGEAREDSDVDLFFDYEKVKLGLYELMDVKEQASRILGRKADIMTRDSLPQGSAIADRSDGAAGVLMAASSPVPRLTDILDAIERIHAEMAGVT
jgi:uncharacterized protein